MTDRLERRLPEVLTELSIPRMPDYVDSLLSRTERMPQRPGWTFLERWIPMSTATATLAARRPASLRPLIVLAIVAAVVAASLFWLAASQKPLPPPFGPARNGILVTNDADGNIVAIDPVTNDVRTLVAGPNLCCPAFSPNGQYFDYLRVPVDGADPDAIIIARSDGTTVRQVPADALRGLVSSDWNPASDRYLVTAAAGAQILDIASGALTKVPAPFAVTKASFLGTSGDILLSSLVNGGASGNTVRVFRLRAGSTVPEEVATLPYAVFDPEVSPDGTKFLYFIWGVEDRTRGRVHVFDLATGKDVAVTPEDEASNTPLHEVEDPHWSPDGSLIVASWLFEGYDQLGLTPAAGGATRFIGPKMPQGFGDGSGVRFSPDGTSVLVHFGIDDSTWILPVSGEPGTKVPWNVSQEWGWQRLGS